MSDVKVYSTPTCPWCKKAKQFLEDKGVNFEDLDVSTDHEAQQKMLEKSGQMGVPVLDIGGEIIVGFDKERIKNALKL